ncbi:hypothetical protein DMX11_11770 [Pseudomonas sp. LB-090624]|nr:hypothetical protein DMX11_11770 [Pseudomonas sp. LB-090624]
MYISRSRKVEEMYIDAQAPAQPSTRYANYPESLYLKMYLNFVAAGGSRQTALERKKAPKGLFQRLTDFEGNL